MRYVWKNDSELFNMMKNELFSAVVGDIMDKHGLLHQFLLPKIQPLRDDMIVAGWAMPVLEADTFEEISKVSKNPLISKPFGLMLEALDDIKENEVYLCTGASPKYALWGEIMSTRIKYLGAVGAVVDGYSRDTKGILELDFPKFSYGRFAQDLGPCGKVIDFRIPIEIEGVKVQSGDIIFGELNGVCVVPRQYEQDIISELWEKANGEKMVKKAIENGMSAVKAFEKYGIM